MNAAALASAQADLARAEARLADLEARRATVLAVAAELEQAIVDAPDWHGIADARERDKAYDHARQCRQRLELLHAGQLLYAPGEAYERVEHLDREITRWRARREAAAALVG
jgi:hypothetical protein